MKRSAITVFLSLMLCINLCGCTVIQGQEIHGREYLVAALGLEGLNGEVNLYIEAVIVNDKSAENEPEIKIINGHGSNISAAFHNALSKASRPLLLSHCATVLVGESTSPELFRELCDFCLENGDIPLSALLIYCKSPKALLEAKPASPLAMGYDLAAMTEQQSSHSGIKYKNRLYEIYSLAEKPLNVFSLPRFKTEDCEYFISGLTVFENFSPKTELALAEAFLYSAITDSCHGGKIILGDSEENISQCRSSVKFSKSAQLEIKLSVNIKGAVSKKELKAQLIAFFNKERYKNGDIFALGNVLYAKEKKLWQTVKDSYNLYFRNSVFTVEFK